MKPTVFHVIMAGGSGTRFWPVSRAGRPKQFLALAGERPLIRQAFDRAAAMTGAERVYVAAGVVHRSLVLEALPALDPSRFIGEPVARNTAGCVGLSALRLARVDPDGVMVVAPADHVYADPQTLALAIGTAVQAAVAGDALVTLGIRPSRPETGYGYIETQETHAGGAQPAKRFVEKPDTAAAARFVASGRYLWNCGVFIWRIRAILRALESCAPDVWSGLQRIDAALGGPEEERVLSDAFAALPSISIDYAVMERAPEVLVVPVDPGWSDVGSWDAVADLQDADAAGNAAMAPADQILALNTSGCLVYSSAGRFIATCGVEDLIVVDTGDALLVCRRGASQSVQAIVQALKARGRTDLL